MKKTKEKMVKPFDWNIGGKDKPMSDKKLTEQERIAIRKKYKAIRKKELIKSIVFVIIAVVGFILFYNYLS